MSCGVGCKCGSELAPTRPLAWEPPYAAGAALKRKREREKKKYIYIYIYSHSYGCEMVSHSGSICISLMTNDVEQFFICLLSTVYLLWRNVYSSPLSIFFFPLYSMGIKLLLHAYIFFPPFVLLQYEYLDIVLNATQQDLLVNLF